MRFEETLDFKWSEQLESRVCNGAWQQYELLCLVVTATPPLALSRDGRRSGDLAFALVSPQPACASAARLLVCATELHVTIDARSALGVRLVRSVPFFSLIIFRYHRRNPPACNRCCNHQTPHAAALRW